MCTFWLPGAQIFGPVHPVCACFFSNLLNVIPLYREEPMDKLPGARFWLPVHPACEYESLNLQALTLPQLTEYGHGWVIRKTGSPAQNIGQGNLQL